MNNIGQNEKMTILYQRLSKDDELQGESNSIVNQRRMLEEYAERNGFIPYESLSDDGYSGTNFNRPAWQELIMRVENDEVGTIILKDSSRMGRNYLQAGLFREMFREKNVRLICVNDGTDTANGEDDFTPFREIMSEWYARDTSRKIKSVIHAKGREGKPLSSTLYGYRRDPNDKNGRIIDEEAAEVVRRIFRMTVDGMGPYQIAKRLMDEKVERPSYYLVRAGILVGDGKCNYNLRYNWRGGTIITMLKKREYMGDLVNFKMYTPSFKSKKQVANAPENVMIFEDAIPQIIDRPTWELAQTLRRTIRRISGEYETNPLTGLLLCSDCGGKLHNRRSHYTEDKNGNRAYPVDTYECSNYRKNAAKFVDVCSIHFVRTSVVRELVLTTIRKVTDYAKLNEAEFVAKLREASDIKQADCAKASRKQLAKNERRISELDTLFLKIYEDNALGKLSDERFAQVSVAYDAEQATLKTQTAAMKTELEAFEQDGQNADRFLALVKRYTAFDELTTPMINEFVEKIIVHEADKSSGERRQQIDVYLNFIGDFTVPGDEPKPLTAEEEAAEEKRLAKKRKKNENLRNWRKKRREEKAAQAQEDKKKAA